METGAEQRQVHCAACGRHFKWKPELAGRTMRCPCGTALLVPVPAAPEDDADAGLYDFAEQPEPAPRRATVATMIPPVGLAAAAAGSADAPVPAAAAATATTTTTPAIKVDLPPQRKGLRPEPRPAVDDVEELVRPSAVRDVVLPVLLIVVGVALRFVEVTATGERPVSGLGPAVGAVALKLALSVGLMLAGMFLVVQLCEVCFIGPLPRTAFKLVEIAVGPGALYGILTHFGGPTYGSMIGTFASVAAFGLLFWLLMRLDAKDAGICVLVTWILITAANYAAYRAEGLIRASWV